jgi:hypothetical protein
MLSFLQRCSYLCGLRNGLTVLVVATLGVLAALAVVDALRSSPRSTAPTTASSTTPSVSLPTLLPASSGSREEVIEEIGNTWARLFAAGDPRACTHMLKPRCQLEPSAAFRASFRGATVQDIRFKNNHDAGASFSNGVVVEFWGDGGTWKIRTVVADPQDFQ